MKGQKVLLSSNCDEWATPQELFNLLDKEFNFKLDACATYKNKKVEQYFNKRDNGLKLSWSMYKSVFVNPPYSVIKLWVEKCYKESLKGITVVMLIPGRVDTSYFHDYIFPYAKEIRFIRGRLKFNKYKNPSTFPSVVIIFKRHRSPLKIKTIDLRKNAPPKN